MQVTVSQTQNFALLAIPLFILAGNFMNKSGITERLLDLASVMTGWLRGGLAQVSIALAALMGGVSGSAIADAAMQVFWRRGYAATSVQDLVDGTGLGRGSLYNAFGSKQGLYEAALRRYHELTAANLDLLARPGIRPDTAAADPLSFLRGDGPSLPRRLVRLADPTGDVREPAVTRTED